MTARVPFRLILGAWFVMAPALAHTQARPGTPAERRLDRPDATWAQEFSLIAGLRELPDGRVMISDGIDEVVQILDPGTGRATRLGRVGSGPGEYRSPDALFALPQGQTLLVDLGNGRLSVLGPDGTARSSMPIAEGTPSPGAGVRFLIPRFVDAQGRYYHQPPAGLGAGAMPPDSAAVVRVDLSRGTTDTVAFIRLAPPSVQRSGSASNQNVRMMPQPFPASDGWAVTPDGRVAIVRAADYRVEWVTPGGRVRGEPVTTRPVPVRDAERREWAESVGRGLSIAMENRNGEITTTFRRGRPGAQQPDLSGVDWPSHKPAFVGGGTFTTSEGELWVERSVAAGASREYDVFDHQGNLTTRFLLQPRRRVIGFGTGTIYVVRSDEDDLQYLERYRR